MNEFASSLFVGTLNAAAAGWVGFGRGGSDWTLLVGGTVLQEKRGEAVRRNNCFADGLSCLVNPPHTRPHIYPPPRTDTTSRHAMRRCVWSGWVGFPASWKRSVALQCECRNEI